MKFLKNKYAAGGVAKAIILFLVVAVIFAGLFGTIAYQLETLAANSSVAAIPGATAILPIVSLMGIIMILMYAIKRAF